MSVINQKMYAFEAAEPRIVGEFDIEKAQAFANAESSLPSKISGFNVYSKHTQPNAIELLGAFAVSLDPSVNANVYRQNLTVQTEYTRTMLSRESDVANLWHYDMFGDDDTPGTFQFGSSCHPIEVVCGAVHFTHDLTLGGIDNFFRMTQREGQAAVEEALTKGDAWIYEPKGGLDGKIIELKQPNIHRRRQSEPTEEFRLILKSFNVY